MSWYYPTNYTRKTPKTNRGLLDSVSHNKVTKVLVQSQTKGISRVNKRVPRRTKQIKVALKKQNHYLDQNATLQRKE
jgi:hypothetical protein